MNKILNKESIFKARICNAHFLAQRALMSFSTFALLAPHISRFDDLQATKYNFKLRMYS